MSRHKDKPCRGQMELAYVRQDRRNMVNNIQIPRFNYVNSRGRKVYVCLTATMKDLLKVIEDHCGKEPDDGWYFFLEEIASEMSVNERTATRAIADCIGGGLLIVERSFYKHKRSKYQIVWSKVTEIIRCNPDTAKWAPPDSKKAAEVTHDKPPTTHDKLSFTHDKSAFTHDKLSLSGGGTTTSSRARGFHHDSLPNAKPSWRPNQYAGWPFKIELPHLKHSESINRLWIAALARPDLDLDATTDRIRFFALARFVARLTGLGEIVNPGGYFHSQVLPTDAEGRRLPPNWLGEPLDREWAAKAVAYVDCRDRETPADRAAREGRR